MSELEKEPLIDFIHHCKHISDDYKVLHSRMKETYDTLTQLREGTHTLLKTTRNVLQSLPSIDEPRLVKMTQESNDIMQLVKHKMDRLDEVMSGAVTEPADAVDPTLLRACTHIHPTTENDSVALAKLKLNPSLIQAYSLRDETTLSLFIDTIICAPDRITNHIRQYAQLYPFDTVVQMITIVSDLCIPSAICTVESSDRDNTVSKLDKLSYSSGTLTHTLPDNTTITYYQPIPYTNTADNSQYWIFLEQVPILRKTPHAYVSPSVLALKSDDMIIDVTVHTPKHARRNNDLICEMFGNRHTLDRPQTHSVYSMDDVHWICNEYRKIKTIYTQETEMFANMRVWLHTQPQNNPPSITLPY